AEAAYCKAIEVFEELIKEFPENAHLWNEVAISQSGLSFALFAQGRKREADDALVSCFKNWRPSTGAHRFGTPTNLGPHHNTPYLDGTPKQRADGLEMFFGSNRDGGYGHVDIWTATRASTDDEWSDPVNLGEPINANFYDGTPTISSDGLEMVFPSVREGVLGSCDLWVTERMSTSEPWSHPVNLGEVVNTSVWEGAPCLSADGLSLFFESSRSGGEGYDDLWVTTRPSRSEPWGKPVSLGPSVNSPHAESSPCISPDGLTLFFGSARPCGFGDIDIWMATRATVNAPWSEAVNLGPGVNTLFLESHPSISPDGSVLYIGVSGRPRPDGQPDYKPGKDGLGNWDAYRVPILKLDGESRRQEVDDGE
ncbi:MAG: TolB family protein, partial [Planctomycetota bacterium]